MQGLQGDAGWAGRRVTLWAGSPWFVDGRPCDCPGVPRARIRSCRVARLVSVLDERDGSWCLMRFIGLDVLRDFWEVAIAEAGEVRLAGRVQTEPAALRLFAQSLGGEDEVALEATGNALGIARIIEPYVGRVVLANPKAVKGITRAGAKTDKIDARTLAKLLAGGFLPAVWLPDEQTRILRRRISMRAQLVRQRTRAKNKVHATLIRNRKGTPPVSDLFGVRGRRWLDAQELPADEQETIAACLRQIEFSTARSPSSTGH